MRLADVNDYVFDTLMDENDKITYNLFNLIRNDSSSFIVTDDKYYIYAQNSRRAPHWLFIKDIPDEKSFEELVALVSGMLKLNPLLKINGYDHHIKPILEVISERYHLNFTSEITMNVLACKKLTKKVADVGKMITPKEEHRQILTEYVSEMSADKTGYFMPNEDTEKFVSALINSSSLYLWENGKIVSMAKVAHKTDKYARINTVYTDEGSRGKGYTRMLISQISENLMQEGLIPIVYADISDTVVINAFSDLGFENYGCITQFAFVN